MIVFLAGCAFTGAVTSTVRCVIAVREYKLHRHDVRFERHGNHFRTKETR